MAVWECTAGPGKWEAGCWARAGPVLGALPSCPGRSPACTANPRTAINGQRRAWHPNRCPPLPVPAPSVLAQIRAPLELLSAWPLPRCPRSTAPSQRALEAVRPACSPPAGAVRRAPGRHEEGQAAGVRPAARRPAVHIAAGAGAVGRARPPRREPWRRCRAATACHQSASQSGGAGAGEAGLGRLGKGLEGAGGGQQRRRAPRLQCVPGAMLFTPFSHGSAACPLVGGLLPFGPRQPATLCRRRHSPPP